MKKISLLFFFIFMVQSYASTPARGPSVEPLMEVDIETEQKPETAAGYDFNPKKSQPVTATRRIPANIVSKENSNKPSNYVGPFLFLLTLPIALWILVSKRFKGDSSGEKEVGYYAKTHQFPGNKAHYQSADEDDDIDYPKAS